MDDEQNGQGAEPKISVVDMVLVGLFLAMLDVIDLIPFAGDLTDVFAAPLMFYYFIKNINGIAYIGSLVLDAIPGTQEIPTRSIVWWGTVIIDRMAPKKLEQALEQTGELAQGGEGAEAAEGAAGAAEGAAQGAAGAAEGAAEGAEATGAAAAETGTAAAEAGAQGAETEAGTMEHAPADEMTPEEERNPMENLQEELEEPKENTFSEGSEHGPGDEEMQAEEKSEDPKVKESGDKRGKSAREKVIDIRDHVQSALAQNQNQGAKENGEAEEDNDEELDEAA